jgi:hypothetical protein
VCMLVDASYAWLQGVGLSRVQTSTATSAGRPDASDDPTDVRLGGRPPSGRRGRRPPRPTNGGGRPPSDCRKGWPSAGRRGRPPRPSDGGGRLPRPPEAVRNCRPPEAVRLRRPSGAVHLRRPLSMTPISPFYTMCLLL